MCIRSSVARSFWLSSTGSKTLALRSAKASRSPASKASCTPQAKWASYWRAWGRRANSHLNDFFDNPALDQRQSLIATQMRIGQLVLIEAQQVQNRGVDIAKMVGLLDGFEAD